MTTEVLKKGTREELAVAVLREGGYFRKALETVRFREKFVTRLRAANGVVVKGVGFATFAKLEEAGMLERRECSKSSAWPTEWVMKGGA